ncbi:MAG: hypothetical protein QOD06_943 [Candidatus Binatota bacterium]|nr:hypothetical protein [Candidatus Binatota bacterium]
MPSNLKSPDLELLEATLEQWKLERTVAPRITGWKIDRDPAGGFQVVVTTARGPLPRIHLSEVELASGAALERLRCLLSAG